MRRTTQWRDIDGTKAYGVEISFANTWPAKFAKEKAKWLTSQQYVRLTGPGMETVERGVVHRLMPSDETRVKVWVRYRDGSTSKQRVKLVIEDENGVLKQLIVGVDALDVSEAWTEDVAIRDTPEWVCRSLRGLGSSFLPV